LQPIHRFLQTFFPISGEIGHGVYYRRMWLYGLAVIALWLLFMFIQWRPLGFIALAATVLGAVWALMLAARTRGFPRIWYDREGQIFRHDQDDMFVSDDGRPGSKTEKPDV
jgi:hypothetical protein